MRSRLEVQAKPVMAAFTRQEVDILEAAAKSLKNVKMIEVPGSKKVGSQSESGQPVVIVALQGDLGILFERADQISREIAKGHPL